MYPHRIRLRGPWQAAPARRVRRFGWPRPPAGHEHVWLACDGVPAGSRVVLNDRPLGTCSEMSFERDVTDLLAERNGLTLEFDTDPGEAWGDVALEVRCPAFLRDTRIRPVDDRLVATGLVVGPAGLGLELYALVGRRTVDYAAVEADPAGRPFALSAPLPAAGSGEPPLVQVDLVHGASVWYRVLQPLTAIAPATPGAGD
jgi:hypothetical protein